MPCTFKELFFVFPTTLLLKQHILITNHSKFIINQPICHKALFILIMYTTWHVICFSLMQSDKPDISHPYLKIEKWVEKTFCDSDYPGPKPKCNLIYCLSIHHTLLYPNCIDETERKHHHYIVRKWLFIQSLVAAMASNAAIASSRIPTTARLPSKSSHSYPTQCFSKVLSFSLLACLKQLVICCGLLFSRFLSCVFFV